MNAPENSVYFVCEENICHDTLFGISPTHLHVGINDHGRSLFRRERVGQSNGQSRWQVVDGDRGAAQREYAEHTKAEGNLNPADVDVAVCEVALISIVSCSNVEVEG